MNRKKIIKKKLFEKSTTSNNLEIDNAFQEFKTLSEFKTLKGLKSPKRIIFTKKNSRDWAFISTKFALKKLGENRIIKELK